MLQGGNILLKSTSTMVDPRGMQCKIGDFGLSRVMNAGANHVTTDNFGGDPSILHATHVQVARLWSMLMCLPLRRHCGILRARGEP